MRILYVVPYFGTPGVLSDALPGHLVQRGHEVHIAGYAPDKKGVVSSERKIFCFHFVNAINFSIPNLFDAFPYFLRFETVMEQSRPDIVHVNNLPFLSSFQSIIAARKRRIPAVLHVHGVIGVRNWLLNTAQYMFIATIMQKAFHEATRIICLTRNDALEIQKLGCPYEKIRIIPNGVDTEKFRPSGETIDDLVLWSGRFVPEKGLEYLVKALALIVREKPQTKLVMAGDGFLFPKIYAMVKYYGLEKNVLFKGWIPHDKLPNLIGKASVYVLPSLKEGLPYALLEAMACGKAVIGSNIPGINDIITHGVNGLLAPPRNPKALAKAIIQLLEDKNLRIKLGHNARQLVVKKYSWQKIVKKIEKLYGEVLSVKEYK